MRHLAVALLPLLLAAPALAQERSLPPADERAGPRESRNSIRNSLRRLRRELGIERSMVEAQLRGMLGRRPPAPDWRPRRSGRGRLERGPGGVPILHLEGTPEEMGRQHGELLRDEIGALRSYVRDFVGARRLRQAARRAEALFAEDIPERYYREAEALARAADMPLVELLFAQCFTDIYRVFGCSTLAAESSTGEGTFLARNLDFPTLGYLGRYSLVIVARPRGRRPFVSIGWPGMLGVLSGQNDALAAAVLVVHGLEGARPGLPFQFAFRRVLEECQSVDQAEALLRKTRITVTNNLIVADRQGGKRVLELHPEHISARGPDAGGLLSATNHFLHESRRVERFSFTYLNSRRRLQAVRDTCPAAGPLRLERARQALDAASTPFTCQSMVFLPRTGALEVAFSVRGSATKRRFVRLEAEHLLAAR
ncbi:MAG TPA: hypothetical protein DEA08_16220 [Planctomycetes bacterium]|nr:hypothetical protein [Planctomycetota bacterium]